MKPKKWIAVVLSIFASPLAFLYVGSRRWAVISFAVSLATGIANFLLPGRDAEKLFFLVSVILLVLWIWQAYRLAGAAPQEAARPWYARWYGLTGVALVAMALMVLLRVFLFEPFKAPSTSMEPAVPRGANLLVRKLGYGHYSAAGYQFGNSVMTVPVARGDIIAFDFPLDPGITYIKRVAGLPGDKIVYRDKHLLINGVDVRGQQMADYLGPDSMMYFKRYRERLDGGEHEILINDAVPSWRADSGDTLPPQCAVEQDTVSCTVPAASYFVLGDNRDNSRDSRYWGFVPARAVVGKVVYIVPPRL